MKICDIERAYTLNHRIKLIDNMLLAGDERINIDINTVTRKIVGIGFCDLNEKTLIKDALNKIKDYYIEELEKIL